MLAFGDVKLIGMAATHLQGCGREFGIACRCLTEPRLTSAVVDEWRRPLREAQHDGHPLTGEARHLRSLDAGDEVEVLSGKTYRLVGPRREAGYDSFASGSIFHVYAVEDARREAVAAPWWRRVLARASGRRAWP